MDGPAGMWGSEFETNSGDTVDFTQMSISVIKNLDFDKMVMESTYHNPRILHQAFWYRHVAHDGTDAADLETQDMWWNAIVSQHRKVIWSRITMFFNNPGPFFDKVGAVVQI